MIVSDLTCCSDVSGLLGMADKLCSFEELFTCLMKLAVQEDCDVGVELAASSV